MISAARSCSSRGTTVRVKKAKLWIAAALLLGILIRPNAAVAGAQRAIVSCGYNAYGHPTEETLERLQNHGIEIYRTDQLGSVTVRLN